MKIQGRLCSHPNYQVRSELGLTASENYSHWHVIICSCANINDRKVREAMSRGARTLADIQVELGAGMGCGTCRDAVNEEISKFYGAIAQEPGFYPETLAPN
jgi:bacterioferritin-associated ferredoxin